MLDDASFWQLVDRAGSGAVEDRAAQMATLLEDAPASRLESWRQLLVGRVAELNTAELQAAMRVVCGPQDGDAFAADRSWLVAHGHQVFETAKGEPDELASLADLDQVCDGSGEAFADAATPHYSDLGFEPGGDAFPDLDLSAPKGTSDGRFPLLHKRFG